MNRLRRSSLRMRMKRVKTVTIPKILTGPARLFKDSSGLFACGTTSTGMGFGYEPAPTAIPLGLAWLAEGGVAVPGATNSLLISLTASAALLMLLLFVP